MSVVKDNYFAALCTQDKNFAICGKIKFSKRMPQKQEQLRVLRNPLDVTAFFISKHFISRERRLLRFQMSHPGQSGWPKILTITIAVGGFNSNWSGKNIYPFFSSQTMSSLEKAVKDWIEFFFTLHKILYFIGDTKSTKDSQSLDLTCNQLFNDELCWTHIPSFSCFV